MPQRTRLSATKIARALLVAVAAALAVALAGCAADKVGAAEYPPVPPPPPSPEAAMAPGATAESFENEEMVTGNFGPNDATIVARAMGPKKPAPTGGLAKTPPPPPPPPKPEKQRETTKPEPAAEQQVARGPMLIYTADITMAVFEVQKSLGAVEQVGRDLGGFLAKRDDEHITIRVPAAKFQEAVARIEKIGDMIHRNVSTEDVSEQFNDLEVQLKNARAVRDRLEQLLSKAQKVEESLAIERELDRIKVEIDRLEGRMKFLRDRADYSTITVSFQAKSDEKVGANRPKLPARWLNELGLGRLLQL